MAAKLTYTSVNDSNLNSLSSLACIPELVYLGHDMRREGVLVLSGHLALLNGHLDRVSSVVDRVFGVGIPLDGPHVFDDAHFGHLGRPLLRAFSLGELDRCALEELEVELFSELSFSINLSQESPSVLRAAMSDISNEFLFM